MNAVTAIFQVVRLGGSWLGARESNRCKGQLKSNTNSKLTARKGVSAALRFLDRGAARTRQRGAAGTRLLAHESVRFIVLQGITYTILMASGLSAVPMRGSYERL